MAPFALSDGGIVKANAFINDLSHGPTVTAAFGVDRQGWLVVRTSLDSPFGNGGAAGVAHLLNDNPKTYWQTYHNDKTLSMPPHEVVLDMGREIMVEAFTMMPRDDGTSEGTPDQYAFFLSVDGEVWTLAAEGEFTDVKHAHGMRMIPVSEPLSGRYLRFVAKHAVHDCNYVSVAGIGVIESKA